MDIAFACYEGCIPGYFMLSFRQLEIELSSTRSREVAELKRVTISSTLICKIKSAVSSVSFD